MSTLGFVPGVLLYFVFGITAMYTGLTLYRLFLDLDKPERYFIYSFFTFLATAIGLIKLFLTVFFEHSMPWKKPQGPGL
jgi:amino acid permease